MPVCCGYCHGKLSSRRWKTCPHCKSPLTKDDIVDCKHLNNSSGDTTNDLLKGADKRIGKTLGSADWLLPKKRRR